METPKRKTARRRNNHLLAGRPCPERVETFQRPDEGSGGRGGRQRSLVTAMQDAEPLPREHWMDPVPELPAEPVDSE